MSYYQVIVKGQ